MLQAQLQAVVNEKMKNSPQKSGSAAASVLFHRRVDTEGGVDGAAEREQLMQVRRATAELKRMHEALVPPQVEDTPPRPA